MSWSTNVHPVHCCAVHGSVSKRRRSRPLPRNPAANSHAHYLLSRRHGIRDLTHAYPALPLQEQGPCCDVRFRRATEEPPKEKGTFLQPFTTAATDTADVRVFAYSVCRCAVLFVCLFAAAHPYPPSAWPHTKRVRILMHAVCWWNGASSANNTGTRPHLQPSFG